MICLAVSHDIRGDKTQVGHVLGNPDKRSMIPEPERSLSPSGCALIRLLLHSVLVWSSCNADEVNLFNCTISLSLFVCYNFLGLFCRPC